MEARFDSSLLERFARIMDQHQPRGGMARFNTSPALLNPKAASSSIILSSFHESVDSAQPVFTFKFVLQEALGSYLVGAHCHHCNSKAVTFVFFFL